MVQQLDLSLDGQAPPRTERQRASPPAPGRAASAELFALLTQAWSRPAVNVRQPLRVLAVDGVVWSAPDTPENESNWALQQPAWPLALAADPRRLPDGHTQPRMLDAKLGAMDCGELSLAAQLRVTPVTLFDRAYFSAAFCWTGGLRVRSATG